MSQEDGASGSEVDAPNSSELEQEALSTDTDSIMALNTNKAGMEGLDKDRINRIIIEASKGSKFYNNQTKRQLAASKRNYKLKQEMDSIRSSDLERARSETDFEIELLETTRDLSSVMVHVDMDAFYASVEMRDDPTLRDIPMAVGGNSMLATSNYVARKFGVRAGMPGFIGKKLCPELKIISGSYDKYRAVSKAVRNIFVEYDPEFSPMGLDEAYINITKHVKFRIQQFLADTSCSDPVFSGLDIHSKDQYWDRELVENVVREMRSRIEEATHLTASAGIAANTLLAKICSDMNKPNGQFFLPPIKHSVIEFIRELPVRKICGIGKVTEEMLKALGITKVHQLYEKRAELKLLMTDCSFQNFIRICMGLGSTELEVRSDRKSMSTERTFSEISQPDKMHEMIEMLSSDLSEVLKKKGIAGCTVGIKLKTVEFEIKTRVVTLRSPTNDATEICHCARSLLDKEIALLKPDILKLRLMGVRVSGFGHGDEDLNQTEAGESKPKRRRVQGKETSILSLVDMFNSNSNSLEPTNSNSTSVLQASDEPKAFSFRDILSKQNESSGLDSIPKYDRDNSPIDTTPCPICHNAIPGDNYALNLHIDSCLSREYIREELPNSVPNSSVQEPGKASSKQAAKSQLSIQSFCIKTKDKT